MRQRPVVVSVAVSENDPQEQFAGTSNALSYDPGKRAAQGITSLLLRQGVVLFATFAGGIVLARILSPAQFGLFAIATFLVSLFAVLGDFGLAPSLVQRREELTDRDLSVAFTVQQVFTLFISCVLFLAAPFVVGMYPQAPPPTVWLVRVLAISLYLTSWRSMSVLQLERHLRFKGLARIEALEVLVYQGIALGLAANGFGVWSLVVAVLVRTLFGAIGLYALAPYRVRFAFDLELAKQILRFGIPFQSQTIANSIGGWVVPGVAGVLLGPSAVGFLGWASANGRKPLLAVDSVMRVAFPHFSRIQHDRDQLIQTVIRYLAGLILLANLWFALVLTGGPALVAWIYTSKWLPGLVALDLFALSLIFDTITWVVGLSVDAVGSVGAVTRLTMVRTAITVVLSIPFVFLWGLAGIPLAFLIGSAAIIPRLISHLGDGALKLCARRLGWIALPLTVGVGVGLAANRVPLPVEEHGIVTALAVSAVYFAVSYALAPNWLKGSLQNRSRGVVLRFVLSRRPA